MTGAVESWIGSIVVDCGKFDEMVSFWKAALGYEQRGARDEGWTLLTDPKQIGANLAFRKEAAVSHQTWWVHLDLYSSNPDEEVARLVRLGATITEPKRADRDFVTLEDPDGNPFDVVAAVGYTFGQRSD